MRGIAAVGLAGVLCLLAPLATVVQAQAPEARPQAGLELFDLRLTPEWPATERRNLDPHLELLHDVEATVTGSSDAGLACDSVGLAVRVRTSDRYEHRRHHTQLHEQVAVEHWRGDELIAVTEVTPDLPDGVDAAVVVSDVGVFESPKTHDLFRVVLPDNALVDSVQVDWVTFEPRCLHARRKNDDRETTDASCLDGVDALVLQMYQAYFGRSYDVTGLEYWSQNLSSGLSLVAVSEHFLSSVEFTDKHANPLDDEAFLRLVYRNAFRREAEETGLRFWLAALAAGRTRSEVVVAVLVQPEGLRSRCASGRQTGALNTSRRSIADLSDSVRAVSHRR